MGGMEEGAWMDIFLLGKTKEKVNFRARPGENLGQKMITQQKSYHYSRKMEPSKGKKLSGPYRNQQGEQEAEEQPRRLNLRLTKLILLQKWWTKKRHTER